MAFHSPLTFLSQLSLQEMIYDNVHLYFNSSAEMSTCFGEMLSTEMVLGIEVRMKRLC